MNSSTKGFVLWFTGLPSSGKTTLAKLMESELKNRGLKVELLDGDEVRKNLSPDLGFTKQDRETHAQRVAYLSKILSRNGIISIVSLISPYREFRARARNLIGNDYLEIWTKCSIEMCIKRDVKGLYKKAKNGIITDMTGVQDPYEEPVNPDILIDTEHCSTDDSIKQILNHLVGKDYLHHR
jgi:adenylyl-sulfate kinase